MKNIIDQYSQGKLPFEELNKKPEWYPENVAWSQQYQDYLQNQRNIRHSKEMNPEFTKAHPRWKEYQYWMKPKTERKRLTNTIK